MYEDWNSTKKKGKKQNKTKKPATEDSCFMTVIVISLLSLIWFNPDKSQWKKMRIFPRNIEITFSIFSTNLEHLCPYQVLKYFDDKVRPFWHLIIKKSQ